VSREEPVKNRDLGKMGRARKNCVLGAIKTLPQQAVKKSSANTGNKNNGFKVLVEVTLPRRGSQKRGSAVFEFRCHRLDSLGQIINSRGSKL
jgi:hypothetical protein